MNIWFFCPLWGSRDLPLAEFLGKVKSAGYDGVEMPLPLDDPSRRQDVLQAIEQQGLRLIAQYSVPAHPDAEQYLAEYRRSLASLVEAQPLLVNVHTGKDWYSMAQNQRFLAAARSVSEQAGVKVIHETHRGRFSFSAAATAAYLEADPTLRIAADFSHWCVVSESLLVDQPAALALAISRADHIHARVGYAEGAQVPDPRAPEWHMALQAHLGWWDGIVDSHKKQGTPVLPITTEFGPVPYMHTLPYTGMPVASQWDINLYMMTLLRERYRAA